MTYCSNESPCFLASASICWRCHCWNCWGVIPRFCASMATCCCMAAICCGESCWPGGGGPLIAIDYGGCGNDQQTGLLCTVLLTNASVSLLRERTRKNFAGGQARMGLAGSNKLLTASRLNYLWVRHSRLVVSLPSMVYTGQKPQHSRVGGVDSTLPRSVWSLLDIPELQPRRSREGRLYDIWMRRGGVLKGVPILS